MQKKKILVTPLNWGLGHATRCIPIITALDKAGYTPVIASDGAALNLLKKEFPALQHFELPSYNITYTKKASFFLAKLFLKSSKIYKNITLEKKATQQLVAKENISGIISDNRMGVFSSRVPSIYITHQLNVLSGAATGITSTLHKHYLRKFDECWIPDVETTPNLSGKLGHLKNSSNLNLKYIGPLSRLNMQKTPIIYKVLVILSGPEPQRGMLEEILLKELENFPEKVLFVRGVIEKEQTIQQKGKLTIYNYLTGNDLERAFCKSEIVLARSGYTTIMDLAKLKKKAFFIPTPGQPEQEYLAKKLANENIAPFAKQNDFKISMLSQVERYKGLNCFRSRLSFISLFKCFERK